MQIFAGELVVRSHRIADRVAADHRDVAMFHVCGEDELDTHAVEIYPEARRLNSGTPSRRRAVV